MQHPSSLAYPCTSDFPQRLQAPRAACHQGAPQVCREGVSGMRGSGGGGGGGRNRERGEEVFSNPFFFGGTSSFCLLSSPSQAMGTKDVRIDQDLNKFVWSQGVRYVLGDGAGRGGARCMCMLRNVCGHVRQQPVSYTPCRHLLQKRAIPRARPPVPQALGRRGCRGDPLHSCLARPGQVLQGCVAGGGGWGGGGSNMASHSQFS